MHYFHCHILTSESMMSVYLHCFHVLVKVLGKQCHSIMTKVNKMLIIEITINCKLVIKYSFILNETGV